MILVRHLSRTYRHIGGLASINGPSYALGANISRHLPARDANIRLLTSKVPLKDRIRNDRTTYYMASMAVAMFAASFAAVPLYRLFCQVTGKPGQAVKDEDSAKIADMKVDKSRTVTVRFDAATHSSMAWNFSPVQEKLVVHPGETALAFYRVRNPLDEPVIGVATYTVLPYEAGQYFNKIQCFCFEEQLLRPHEDVFMPVLFYIDPEFSKDPQLATQSDVVLSYTFFRSKDGELVDLEEPIELKKHNK